MQKGTNISLSRSKSQLLGHWLDIRSWIQRLSDVKGSSGKVDTQEEIKNVSRHDEHCGRLRGMLERRVATWDLEKT